MSHTYISGLIHCVFSTKRRRNLIPAPNYRDPAAQTLQAEPSAELLRRSLARGQFPFWDPYTGGGIPMFASLGLSTEGDPRSGVPSEPIGVCGARSGPSVRVRSATGRSERGRSATGRSIGASSPSSDMTCRAPVSSTVACRRAREQT